MKSSRKGYGSHSFLNEYIVRNSCKKIMEIGVAGGENAKTMVKAASQNSPVDKIEYYGFDTFGGKDNSRMKNVSRKLESTGCKFRLFKGNSIETLPEAVKSLPLMDFIFIDGGHSYQAVKSD
ncbi:hypothetical protein AKJ44_02780 [candidate division MSBL1 archaeon SCGC-AAA261F17]|uniref:Methyltransferase domain-containing protein n=1 Tax=candidate division MSBL1 archaeon SCGC-AAA261F17 TaxID=1698274 RepID=A0A133V457_9EURY|nr:hypothetical protein AKJ44_02780 [candidate division MSBL1 archaeon SCGC-AAA261F17]